MEDQLIVVAAFHQGFEVLHALGAFFGEQLDLYVAVILNGKYDDLLALLGGSKVQDLLVFQNDLFITSAEGRGCHGAAKCGHDQLMQKLLTHSKISLIQGIGGQKGAKGHTMTIHKSIIPQFS